MRGQPLFRALLVAAVFAALAVPLWKLTRPAQAQPADAAAGTTVSGTAPDPMPTTATSRLEVTFSAPPREFSVRHLERTLLEGRGPGQVFAADWTAALPKEGADLVLRAAWPEEGGGGAPAAVRVTVRFPGGQLFDRTLWTPAGAGALAEVVTVTPDAGGVPGS